MEFQPNQSSNELQFFSDVQSSERSNSPYPDKLDLDELRRLAEVRRKSLERPSGFLIIVFTLSSAFTLIWSVTVRILDAPTSLYPDSILGFSIMIGIFEVALMAYIALTSFSSVREQERIDNIFNRLFPALPHQQRLLRPEQSRISVASRIFTTYILFFIIFAVLIPYSIGTLMGQRDVALWFGLGLHPALGLLTVDFWLGKAFLPWIRPEIYPPESLWPRRLRITANWLIIILLVEMPVFLILALGGRHANIFYSVILICWDLGWMLLLTYWPAVRIMRPIRLYQPDKAMRRVKFWKRMRPYLPVFASLEAFILYRQDRYNEGIEVLNNALIECPDQSFVERVVTSLGLCYEKLKDFDRAIPIYAALTEIQPHRALGYAALAEVYADDVPNPQRALEMINVSIEQLALTKNDPLHNVHFGAMLWAVRGWILQQLGDIEQSDDSLRRAWAVPLEKDALALACLQHRTGLVMLDRGEMLHGINYLQAAVATDPLSASGKQAAKKLAELQAQET